MREGKYVDVLGFRTHYFEAGAEHKGKGPTLLLLHSAEFGGCAEFSWERNLEALGARHHVLAPDHLGFGLTDKLFDFCGQFGRRIWHIARFIETMGVKEVVAGGSSMSGGLCLAVAARDKPDWPMAGVICCSGGGDAPNNEERKILNSYDGTKEHMRKIVEVCFHDKSWAAKEDYIDRRVEMANLPGGWEATAAARLKAPFREGGSSERSAIDYANIKIPALVFAGRHDPLRNPGYTDDFVPKMPKAELHIFENASHLGNVECADEFNAKVLEFMARI
jgi:pimeloyl-ACP methyl ester carboxylesterase